jgi:hypothetical protein
MSIILGDFGFQEGGRPHGLRLAVGSKTATGSTEDFILKEGTGSCLFVGRISPVGCSSTGGGDSDLVGTIVVGVVILEVCSGLEDARIKGEATLFNTGSS